MALPPTPANIKYAHRIAADIRKRIALGTFALSDFFPDSPRAKASSPHTFGPLVAAWLKAKGQLQPATLSQYRNAAAFWVAMFGHDKPLAALDYQALASAIGAYPWASGKLANNYLIVLRGVMAFEYAGPRAALNPMTGIKNLAVVKKLPDPLSAGERDRILADMAQHYPAQVVAYFRFAFTTGMRPEELIALRWEDIDFAQGTARVQRVKTFKGSEREGSKTHAVRDVDLVPPALDALAAMKPFTYLARKAIFQHPVTAAPWHDERAQRDTYWKPSLKRTGVRYRPAYNTRHTFATVALMAGVRPAYIAAQLGHANSKMLHEKYAKWIEGADQGAERKRMAAAYSSQIHPSASDDQKQ